MSRERMRPALTDHAKQEAQLIGNGPHNVRRAFTEPVRSRNAFEPLKQPKEEVKISERQPTKLPRRQNHSMITFLFEWWPEVAAVTASAAFLAAILALLLIIHDTALAKWTMPYSIQPTTLIAILITFCKLFLLAAIAEAISQLKWTYFDKRPHKLQDIEHFDSASRGAFGSVLFVFKIRWRAVIACAGALITMLALAMEPFAQQSLTFYNKRLPTQRATALIPHATNYDLFTAVVESPYAGGLDSMSRKFYAPMLGAMLQGLYNPNNTVPFECESSNCTWPQFDTLSICSSCEDVSDSLTTNCHYKGQGDGGGYCRFETPHHIALGASCLQNYGGSNSTLWNSTTATIDLPGIARIAAISISADDPALSLCAFDENKRIPKPAATECTLSWCSKSIRSTVTNGTLTEHPVSSTELIFPYDTCNASSFYQHPADWSLEKVIYTKPDVGYDVQIYAAFKPGEVPENLCSGWRFKNNSAFWINVQDSANIYSLLETTFTQADNNVQGSAFGRLFYSVNHADLSKDIHSIAKSMTNQIRQGPNMTQSLGTAWITETYVKVNWLWLIYPLAILLLGVGFLISSIANSSQRNRVVWKSSSLALLFHGLQGWDQTQELRKSSDMKKAASDMCVQLEECDGGDLKLVKKIISGYTVISQTPKS